VFEDTISIYIFVYTVYNVYVFSELLVRWLGRCSLPLLSRSLGHSVHSICSVAHPSVPLLLCQSSLKDRELVLKVEKIQGLGEADQRLYIEALGEAALKAELTSDIINDEETVFVFVQRLQ
jgi:hypothetical protein